LIKLKQLHVFLVFLVSVVHVNVPILCYARARHVWYI